LIFSFLCQKAQRSAVPIKIVIMAASADFLSKYLRRVGISETAQQLAPTARLLCKLMMAHSRSIPFENLDVVCGRKISIVRADIVRKLVDERRGGYCWEQNALLQLALEAAGFESVTPLLCRVRWGKASDADGPVSAYTHMALKVQIEGTNYLADVGFSGVNSVAPVNLDVGETPQPLPEGEFRVERQGEYSALQLNVRGEYRALYKWRDEPGAYCDQEACNWYSCTFPSARFTTSFFVCRVVGDERHHILNATYVVRKGHGADSVTETTRIAGRAQLLALLDDVFGLRLAPGESDGVDRYLD